MIINTNWSLFNIIKKLNIKYNNNYSVYLLLNFFNNQKLSLEFIWFVPFSFNMESYKVWLVN